ncbi:hypothetical protein B0O99DRAFT_354655 [Bisporella sp. PMI_857]|nr:hypothetical protein B0O99DRAFT_354655 [Bisporella sp. PMI_857]
MSGLASRLRECLEIVSEIERQAQENKENTSNLETHEIEVNRLSQHYRRAEAQVKKQESALKELAQNLTDDVDGEKSNRKGSRCVNTIAISQDTIPSSEDILRSAAEACHGEDVLKLKKKNQKEFARHQQRVETEKQALVAKKLELEKQEAALKEQKERYDDIERDVYNGLCKLTKHEDLISSRESQLRFRESECLAREHTSQEQIKKDMNRAIDLNMKQDSLSQEKKIFAIMVDIKNQRLDQKQKDLDARERYLQSKAVETYQKEREVNAQKTALNNVQNKLQSYKYELNAWRDSTIELARRNKERFAAKDQEFVAKQVRFVEKVKRLTCLQLSLNDKEKKLVALDHSIGIRVRDLATREASVTSREKGLVSYLRTFANPGEPILQKENAISAQETLVNGKEGALASLEKTMDLHDSDLNELDTQQKAFSNKARAIALLEPSLAEKKTDLGLLGKIPASRASELSARENYVVHCDQKLVDDHQELVSEDTKLGRRLYNVVVKGDTGLATDDAARISPDFITPVLDAGGANATEMTFKKVHGMMIDPSDAEDEPAEAQVTGSQASDDDRYGCLSETFDTDDDDGDDEGAEYEESEGGDEDPHDRLTPHGSESGGDDPAVKAENDNTYTFW